MGNEKRKQFEELNRSFLSGCIENLQSVGSDCCLAPLATNYLLECFNLLKETESGQGPHLSDLGQRLRAIGDRFIVLAAKTEKKTSLPSLPPPPTTNFISPQGVTKQETQGGVTGIQLLPPPPPQSAFHTAFNFGNFGGSNAHPQTNHGTSSEISSTPAAANEGGDEEEQEKEAQAHEFVPVAEDEALYSIRCKIFHKVKEAYEVRGVGQLYLQKTENGSHRMLIRADNSLGNILLNMKLTRDIPIVFNLEKKQVSTIDPHKPCPITILVKTPDLAQTLFNEIEKCKNSDETH